MKKPLPRLMFSVALVTLSMATCGQHCEDCSEDDCAMQTCSYSCADSSALTLRAEAHEGAVLLMVRRGVDVSGDLLLRAVRDGDIVWSQPHPAPSGPSLVEVPADVVAEGLRYEALTVDGRVLAADRL